MSYSPPGQHNPFNPYRGYPLPVFGGNPFVQQPPPFHGPSSLNSMRPIPRPVPQGHDVHPTPHPPQPRPTAPPTPPPGIPYIGARISLISNMNIRYEGTLYTIDPKEATVALQSVRCFGTEGRVPPSEEVAPSPHSYQFIIFRGKDIKDLHVCETPVSRFLPSQPPPPQDPAIVATGTVSSPFGTPMGLGTFSKPDLKQAEIDHQKLAEGFRLSSTEPTTEREDTSKQDKGVNWTPGVSAASQVVTRSTDPDLKATGPPRTPPKSSTTLKSTQPSSSSPPTTSQPPSKKKSSAGQPLEQSKNQNQYKPKPQALQSTQGYQKPKSGGQKHQTQDGNRKPREPKGSGFYGNQKKSEKKPKGQGRQDRQDRQGPKRVVDDDSSRPLPSSVSGPAGAVNYDGPGTGSYLGRRVGNPTLAPAIPQEEFDIQSSNARFDKDRFKEQVLKVTAQKAKTGPATTDTTPPVSTDQPSTEGESTELSDLFKKLKSGSEKSTSNSHLSPSAVPFVPAAEGKKEVKSEKDEKVSIDGIQIPDNLPTAPKYEKKNFYDDISTDRDVSQRRDMVKKDTETFGDIAANYGYYNRQRPRYFSSGGNYRGRGRGGSNRNAGPNRSSGSGYGGGVLASGSGAAYYRAVQRI